MILRRKTKLWTEKKQKLKKKNENDKNWQRKTLNQNSKSKNFYFDLFLILRVIYICNK